MNVVVLIVVVALLMLTINVCHGETPANLTCVQLPKLVFPSIEDLSANSPYEIDYALTSPFDCATHVFTYPARGTTNSNGSALVVNGNTVLTYDYVADSEGKTLTGTICGNGAKSVWYVSALEFNANGAFYCLYSCNGTAFAEFLCASNNDRKSCNESEAVKYADGVSNGKFIHDAQHNCTARRGCNAF